MTKPVAHIKATPYAYFLLFVLTIIMILNFVDRTIISVLAQDIKEGLKVDDASLGFLYGTAFAVFYSVFGIPLARLADVWSRKKIIGIALLFWSLMTAMSGLANTFIALAIFRIGVGIGESAAMPASLSMLSDSFAKKTRATAFGIWSAGIYVGAGLGVAAGGWALGLYHKWWPDYKAPLGIDDWHLAMFIVGIPGILLAFLVFFLREPKRGHMDGVVAKEDKKHVFRFFMKELGGTLPPFTVYTLYKIGGDLRLVARNMIYFVTFFVAAWFLTHNYGNPVQWYALAIGFYSFVSWVQRLEIVDYPCFAMIFKTKTLMYSAVGFALYVFNAAGIGFWVTPYIVRKFQLPPEAISGIMGLIITFGGMLGIVLGGVVSDFWRKKNPKARTLLIIWVNVTAFPFFFLAFTTDTLALFYLFAFFGILISTMGNPSSFAIASELSTPRTRATTLAFIGLLNTMIGFALGPFLYGALSAKIESYGYAEADSLQMAILLGMVIITPIPTFLLFKASQFIEHEENTVVERAAAYGEVE